tara:strand:- start:11502 stop:12302 length:801 start_codon:yes stop_codon:yes gene_type:complete
MNQSPIISIIIPAYNAASYIRLTLDSAINQTFKDFEVLVINDCSADNTATIVESYCVTDKRVKLINLSNNKGAPAGPRNIGVREAKGRWIAFLDADDIWHPQKLERQIDLLNLTGARFCSTQMINFIDEKELKLIDAKPDDFAWISFNQQLIKNRTPTSSVVVDKALMEKFPFNEDMKYKAREDLDCWLHCHEEIEKSVKILQPMMGYRIIDGQISGKKWVMVKRHFYVLRKYRFRSGRELGLGAIIFTMTHFFISVYFRFIKKGL